jgi:hypothetical protein
MKVALIGILLALAITPLSAQQPTPPKAGLEIDLPEIVAEVTAAFERYEKAIVTILDETFRDDPRTIRYGQSDIEYGYKEIAAFRARSKGPGPRTLSKTVIMTFGRDFAVTSALVYRASAPGKVGRQQQTWVRFPEGSRVVAAHVSTIDEPKQ